MKQDTAGFSSNFFNLLLGAIMSVTTKTAIKEEIINLETDISYLQRDLQARYEADKIIAQIQRLEAERRQLLDRIGA